MSLDFSPVHDSKTDMNKVSASDVDPETASEHLGQVSSTVDPSSPQDDATMQGAFGAAAAAGGKQFRVLGRWKAGIVLIHTEVGIGILSLPSVLKKLGMVPGLIAIFGIGILSTYTAYVLLFFWKQHRHVDSLPDAMRVVGGRILGFIGGIGLLINLTLSCASATLTMSVALNTLRHGPATIGIIVPIFIVSISLAIGTPQAAPPGAKIKYELWGHPSFEDGFTAILSIFYAFGGRQGFFMVMAEMKDPVRDYVPALIMLQTFALPLYLVTAGAIYGLAGNYVTSPALGTAPLIPAKVAYAIVLLTLVCTGLFYGHVGIKYLFVVTMRDVLKIPHLMTVNTPKTWCIWIFLGTLFWAVVFVLANAIPVFNSIIAVTSALLVSWFSFGLPGIFWLHLHWKRQLESKRMIAMAALNWFLVAIGIFLNTAGMYAAIDTLVKLFNNKNSAINGPFTCADNSLF